MFAPGNKIDLKKFSPKDLSPGDIISLKRKVPLLLYTI